MASFKMTDEMLEALRLEVYGAYNVRHDYVALEDDDMRAEFACSFVNTSKGVHGVPVAVRDRKLYCATCRDRTNGVRRRIVASKAHPAFIAVAKGITTKAQYDAAMRQWTK